MNDRNDDALMAAASRLATEVSPERDLWRGIEDAMTKPQRVRRTPILAQAAAVLLLVGASSALTYFAVKVDPLIVEVVRPASLTFETTAFRGESTFDSVYAQAEGDVAAQLGQELQRLSPEARDDIERNLAVIRQAIADINEALEKEPDNVLLQVLLLNAYREELSVKHRVGNLAQAVMSRKDI